jgi:hypothetical protein
MAVLGPVFFNGDDEEVGFSSLLGRGPVEKNTCNYGPPKK